MTFDQFLTDFEIVLSVRPKTPTPGPTPPPGPLPPPGPGPAPKEQP